MSSKTTRIIVSFTTKLVDPDNIASLTPEFKAPSNYKDADKIAKYIKERKDNFEADAANQPYTGTFDEVMLVDLQKQLVGKWSSKDRDAADGLTVAEAAASWILRNNPDAFAGDILDTANSNVVFIGFDTRLFLKMLGLDCTLPDSKVQVPLRLWYNNSNHRDITEAVMPSEFSLSWPIVLKLRKPWEADDATKKWDVSSWTRPHVNVQQDSWLITELAAQLGFLND